MVSSFFCGTDTGSGSNRCARYYGALSGGGGASTGVPSPAIQPAAAAAESDDGRHPVVTRQTRRMRGLMVLVVAVAGLLAVRARRTTTAAVAPAFLRARDADGGSEVSGIGTGMQQDEDSSDGVREKTQQEQTAGCNCLQDIVRCFAHSTTCMR